MENLDNLSLLLGMFNQFVFQDAKNNIQEIKYYYQTNPNTNGNRLVDEMIKAIETYDLQAIDQPLFNSILDRCGKTPMEKRQIMDEIIRWKGYTKEQIEPTKKYLNDVICSSIIQRAGRMFQSPSEYLKYLKNVNLQKMDSDVLSNVSFDKVDINTIVANSGEGIPSKFEWINESFQPECKYPLGSVILFTGCPGSGKSIWAMNEAINMASHGTRVHYLMMGDLTIASATWRACTIFSGLQYMEAKQKLGAIYNTMCQVVGDNLMMSTVPAGSTTIDDYIAFIDAEDEKLVAQGKEKIKCCIIDYDAGFAGSGASTSGDTSMYSAYGAIYDKLTELSIVRNKLVIILAQPKIAVYSNEEIPLEMVGESSRKIQVADVVITRGKFIGNQNNLGIFTIVKNRHGDLNKVYSIRLMNGRFRDIPRGVYDLLKQETERKLYTDSDIDSMIHAYNTNVYRINQGVQNQMSAQAQVGTFRPEPNPFGNP